jgi:hypothetical protein
MVKIFWDKTPCKLVDRWQSFGEYSYSRLITWDIAFLVII